MSQEEKDNWEKWIIRGLTGVMFIVAMNYIVAIDNKLDKLEDSNTSMREDIAAQKVTNADVDLRLSNLESIQKNPQTIIYSTQSQPVEQLSPKHKK